jgi:hypothetical protein
VESSSLEQGGEHAVLVGVHFHIDLVLSAVTLRFAHSLTLLGRVAVVVACIDTAAVVVLEQQNGYKFGEVAHIGLKELRIAQAFPLEHSSEEQLQEVREVDLDSLSVTKRWSCGLVVPQTEVGGSVVLCSQFVPLSPLPSAQDAQVSVALVSGVSFRR